MSYSIAMAHRLGFATRKGWSVVIAPTVVTATMTGVTVMMLWVGVVKDGYFSPYVAAIAVVAARVCVRAGLLAAILSILMWDFFVVPPVLTFALPSGSEVTAWLAAFAAGVLVAPRLSKDDDRPVRDAGPSSTGLPFVTRKPTRNGADHTRMTSCWDVQRSGDYSADDHYGRELGRLWVDRVQAGVEGVPPLSFIVLDMLESGEFTGVEAGFANAIERAVASGQELAFNVLTSVPDHESRNFGAQRQII